MFNSEEFKEVKHAAILFLLLVPTSAGAQNVLRDTRTPCTAGLNEESPETAQSLSAFLETLKSALSSNDKRKLADMSAYPLRVVTETGKFKIRSQEDFLQHYEQIFPKSLVDFIETQQPQCISRVGAQGFTVGLGEIWFDQYPDGTVKFFAINPVTLASAKPKSNKLRSATP